MESLNNIFKAIRIAGVMIFSISFAFGCTTQTWENQGDSCVFTASEPPLRRVVNYRDHDLCNRKPAARTPPFPRVRNSSMMQD
ncbi:MAG TPA: hypothetical protein DIT94_00865 [Deltaproteobacteria bacterium]|nr:hypothetical protein [Deltaproteobacteria bacterium]